MPLCMGCASLLDINPTYNSPHVHIAIVPKPYPNPNPNGRAGAQERRASLAAGAAARADLLGVLLDARDEDGQPMTDEELWEVCVHLAQHLIEKKSISTIPECMTLRGRPAHDR